MKRYQNIPVIKSPDGKRMYSTVRYPNIPKSLDDTYIYTSIGDRFDTLAQQFYGDSSLWWVISIANNNISQNSLTPPTGIQIRVPFNPSSVVANFQSLNSPTTVSDNNSGGTNPSY
jgi:hypothetical protein